MEVVLPVRKQTYGEWTDAKKEYLRYLATPEDERDQFGYPENASVQQIAEVLGVHYGTMYTWRKDPEFQKMVAEAAFANDAFRLSDILDRLRKDASVERDRQLYELWLGVHGFYTPETVTTHKHLLPKLSPALSVGTGAGQALLTTLEQLEGPVDEEQELDAIEVEQEEALDVEFEVAD